MDRKSILILVVCAVLFFSWTWLVNRRYPPIPIPDQTNSVPPVSASPGTNGPASRPPTLSAAPTAASFARPEAPEELVTLENDIARYTFTSHGGGLKHLEMKKYPEAVGCRNGKANGTNNVATLNAEADVPAFTLLGDEVLQGDGQFTLTRTPNGIRAEKLLPIGARLVREYQPGTNYLIAITERLENVTNEPIQLPAQEWVLGTATPLDSHDVGTLMSVQWYDGKRAQSIGETWFANRTLGCFAGTPRTIYQAGQSNVYWAAANNRFFAIIAIAPTNAPAFQVVARHVDLPRPTEEELEADPKMVAKPFGFQTALLYPPVVLATNQVIERQYSVFAGPKEYRTLDRLGAKFGNDVDLVMNFGFFGFFAKALLLSMNGLYSLGLPYGLTIIAITIIIKLLFWPLTQASTRSMKRMAALQPQMKAIQEKYKDDPNKKNQKMMEFMKENKVNPAAGCLPILIQIPIFIGFYSMLQSAIELRGARFLWACDLSQPDTVGHLFGVASLPINPLPLIMGLTQLWQMRLTPPSPGMDPLQQKMMQYMPLIFLFILYNFSSGLTLYWTVQNLLTIAQMKLTKSAQAVPAKTPAPAPKSPGPAKKKNR